MVRSPRLLSSSNCSAVDAAGPGELEHHRRPPRNTATSSLKLPENTCRGTDGYPDTHVLSPLPRY